MLPAAPGRLSITTGWPSSGRRLSATTRAVMSVLPPGGYGTTSLTGLDGQLSAPAGPANSAERRMLQTALPKLAILVLLVVVPRAAGRLNPPPGCRACA